MLKFAVLGPVRAWANGVEIALRPQQRAVLAALALHANEEISRAALIEDVWGENPPQTALHAIHVHISALRGALPGLALETRGACYILRCGEELDVVRFRAQAADGRKAAAAGEHPAAADAFRRALLLWSGSIAANAELAGAAAILRDVLEEERLGVLAARIDADLVQGIAADLVPELQALVAEHPLHERFAEQLVLSLYRSGRQSDALAAYRSARAVLIDEVGLDPGPALRALEQAILRHDPSLWSGGRGAALPAPSSSFVGRRDALAALAPLIADPRVRVITLVGPGGIGKTRLAIAAASAAVAAVQRVTFVDLAEGETIEAVAARIASELERNVPGVELVVLDNVENPARGAQAIEALLRAYAHLKLLVTSRVALLVPGEHLVAVAPLELPRPRVGLEIAAHAEAVELFVDRARQALPSFALSPTNVEAVLQICQLTGGIPLALELSAARLRVLPPAELVRWLDERLKLLDGDGTRTVAAAITGSVGLLTALQQELFAHTGVFAGPFSLRAAREILFGEAEPAVAAAGLGALLEHGLLAREGELFRMLPPIAAVARGDLARSPHEQAIRGSHARHYRHAVAELGHRLTSDAEGTTLDALESERAELGAATRWLAEHDPVEAAGLVKDAAPFWRRRGHHAEAVALAQLVDDALPEIKVFERIALANLVAISSVDLGEIEDAESALARSQGLAHQAGDRVLVAYAEMNLGALALMNGRVQLAERLISQALEVFETTTDERGTAAALENLAECWLVRGRFAEAVLLTEKALDHARAGGDVSQIAGHLRSLGRAHLLAGNLGDAGSALAESLHLFIGIGELQGVVVALETAMALAVRLGQAETGALIGGSAASIREQLGTPPLPNERSELATAMEKLRDLLDPTALRAAWAHGRRLAMSDAVAYAIGLAAFGAEH